MVSSGSNSRPRWCGASVIRSYPLRVPLAATLGAIRGGHATQAALRRLAADRRAWPSMHVAGALPSCNSSRRAAR